MAGTPSFISDAELHGLVDGHLESDRRADVLRRLAASPKDRAKLGSWQDQNDLLQHAFGGIEREPLPASLDLAPQPRLQSIALVEPAPEPIAAARPRRSWRGALVGMLTVLVVGAGLTGSWVLLGSPASDDPSVVVSPELVETTLAQRSVSALPAPGAARPTGSSPVGGLPMAQIPDLTGVGFTLVRADSQTTAPASLIFHYQDAAGEHLVISIARAASDQPGTVEPTAYGRTFGWRDRDSTFVVAGTMPPARLRAIAVALAGRAAP